MLPSGGIYAMKKRKKPVQKSPKPPPAEGIKSNPSKRHRDRLNQELNKLTSLLPFPEDVRARLDKLSILRLIVGYLKVKGFFLATMKKNTSWLGDVPGTFGGNGHSGLQINGESISEAELVLQALDGFIIAVTADGYIFYVSPTIQDYLGFHQSDVIYQSVYELIHTDDRAMFRCQLHWALNPPPYDNQESEQGSEAVPVNQNLHKSTNTYTPDQLPPENSSFMERNFVCRFRCLLDNSSGFLALTFQGRLKFLHGQNKRSEDGSVQPPQLAFFAIATPLQPPSILELRTKTFIFQTKHKLDFTPMACDSRGKVVLGYTEMELCMRGTGYQFIHAADMMYCADNHVRMIKTGESGMTVFRLLTKDAGWIWVQANARLVYKGGRPDCIIARQRALSNEEGEEHLRKRALQLPFSFTTGEAVLYQNNLPQFPNPVMPKTKFFKNRKATEMEQKPVDPSSILGAMMKQDESVYVSHPGTETRFPLPEIMNKYVEGWQINHNGVSVKQEGDPVMAILETLLEKSEVGEGPLQDLDVGDLDLEGWEESLLQVERDMDGLSNFSSQLSGEVASFLEDILFKQEKSKDTPFPGGASPAPICLQPTTPRQLHPKSPTSRQQNSESEGSHRLHQPLKHLPLNNALGLQDPFPPSLPLDAEDSSDKPRVPDQMKMNPAICSSHCPLPGDFSSPVGVFQLPEGLHPANFSRQSMELNCKNSSEKDETPVAPHYLQTPSTHVHTYCWPVATNTVPQTSSFMSSQNLMGVAPNHLDNKTKNIWKPLVTEHSVLETTEMGQSSQGVLAASNQWTAPLQRLPEGGSVEYSHTRDMQVLLKSGVEYSRGRGQSCFEGEGTDCSRGRVSMAYHPGQPNTISSLHDRHFHTQTSLAIGQAYQQQQMLSQRQPFSSSFSGTTFQRRTSAHQDSHVMPGGHEDESEYHSSSDLGGQVVESDSHARLGPSAPTDYMYPPCGYDMIAPPTLKASIPHHQRLKACCALSTSEDTYFFQNIPGDCPLSLSAVAQMDPGFSTSSFCQFESGCPSVSLTDGQQLFSYNIQLEQCQRTDENVAVGFTPAAPTQSHIFS
ncbi:aryl hydrocarbon receptor-like [Pleurodeles waltl]|uniref:aryl hydrocarbon receptor-like n=1 Tax=Pleurodeles waltl TaxID=8319 RepID=UPI00370942AE